MIIWINGAFGCGKSSAATALVNNRGSGSRLFDPEWVGFLVRSQLGDMHGGDFQDLPSWRRLTPIVADEIIRATGQELIAVQTVMRQQYWAEIRAGMRALGHEVVHVVLDVDEAELRRRIAADTELADALEWRMAHVHSYIGARDWLARESDLMLNTADLTVEQSAALIEEHLTRDDRTGAPSPADP